MRELLVILMMICIKVEANFTCKDLHEIYDESKHLVSLRNLYDRILQINQITQSDDEVGYEFFKSEFSQPIDYNIHEQYMKAKFYVQTASLFYDRNKHNNFDNDALLLFQNYSSCFSNAQSAPKAFNLTNVEYRSLNGVGNNPKYPERGSSFTAYGRQHYAQYDDKIYAIRKSGRGYELPSPRNIVRKIFLNDKQNLNKFSDRGNIPNMAAIMFAQLIAIDTGSRQIGQYMDGGNDGVRCCEKFNKNQLPSSLMHSSCLPIVISRSDPFYSPRDIRCLDFLRSNIIANNPYKINIGEQVNAVTSFLDLSPIYGSDLQQMAKVRSFNGGRLKTNPSNVMNFENGKFMSADYRSTETPFLMIFHSLFIRSHNNIADKLGDLNREWERDKLFQEARRINIAIYQKIIYKEWLHHIIGREYASFFDDVKMTYNPEVDGSTLNEFSHSVFRIFHSFLPSQFEVVNGDMNVKRFNLSDIINNVDLINSYEDVIRGLMNQKMSTTGYSEEVLNKLYKNKNDIGLDLLSIDIARGRDHGIPAYHKIRKMCNVRPLNVKVYDDLENQISKNTIIQLRQTYKTVYDIDLLVGGALEQIHGKVNASVEESGLLGPTFQCIFFEQFYRWKSGDFYFYSHNTSGFTRGQLKVIEDYTFNHLICENTNLMSVKKDTFLTDGENVECRELKHIDLTLWKEAIA